MKHKSKKKSAAVARANLDAYFTSRNPPGHLKCKTGDRVTYARYFLKATGEPATGSRWFDRGVLTEAPHPTLGNHFALVLWDGQDQPVAANTANLALDPSHHGPSLRFAE